MINIIVTTIIVTIIIIIVYDMDSTGFEVTWYNSSFEIAHYYKLS